MLEKLQVTAQVSSAVVVAWFLLLSLTTGIMYGFAAIKPALLQEGTFAWACDASDSALSSEAAAEGALCNQQLLLVNLVFIFGSAGMNVLALLNGVALDRLGRRQWVQASSVLWACSCALFGLSGYFPPYVDLICYCTSSLMLLTTGGGIFMAVITLARHGTTDRRISAEGVLAAFAITWDLSTGVYWAFEQVYVFLQVPLVWMFEGYAVFIGAALLLLAFKTVPEEPERVVAAREKATSGERGEKEGKEEEKSVGWPWRQLFTVPCIVFTLALSFQMLQVSFFMSSVNEQAEWVNSSGPGVFGLFSVSGDHAARASAQANVFSLLLFVEAPVSFLLALVMKRIQTYCTENSLPLGSKFALAYYVLAVLGGVWGLLSCFARPWWLQFGTYVCMIPYRVFMYICMNTYLLQAYDPKVFGRVNASVLVVVGVASLLAYPLNSLELGFLEGNYFWVNYLLTSCTFLTTFGVVLAMFRRQSF